MSKYHKGKVIRGTITAIEPYGAFLTCDEYYTGLIHISEITNGYVKNINNFFTVGDTLKCRIIDVDEENGHLKLSVKNINNNNYSKRRHNMIKETPQGFKSLAYHLPFWIEDSLKKMQNK